METKNPTTEREIEGFLVNMVEHLGGLCLKFTSPSTVGVPDRVIMSPKTGTFFCELKRPDGELRPTQVQVHRRMTQAGARIYVCHNLDEIKRMLNWEF